MYEVRIFKSEILYMDFFFLISFCVIFDTNTIRVYLNKAYLPKPTFFHKKL